MQNRDTDNYDIIFNAINDAIFIHDVESGVITKVNEAMLSMYGYTHDDIGELTIDDLSVGDPPYDQINAMKHIRDTVAHGSQLFEWRARKKNGDPFLVEVSLSHAAVDHQLSVLAVVRDITHRKKIEQVHQKTKRRLEFTQFTVNQAKIAVFWCHANGFFFYVNDTASEWLQYTREELLQMHVADINPEFPRTDWAGHWQDIKAQGLVRMQSVHRRKNGEVYPVEIYSNYVQFEGKEYKLAFVHDISARKRAEQEKQALEDRLRQAQKMEAIGTLAGGVAHDLNNLLSPILGYSELLKKEFPADEQNWVQLNEIYKAGMRARNLTRQLLTFGRKQALSIKPFDLNAVIVEFEKMLRRLIRENIVINKHLAPNLPSIEGDVGQIEQIIMNLAVNAQDAMPHGGILSIKTRVKYLDETFPEFGRSGKAGYHVMMAVTDTGDGIDKEILSRIFEPFFTTKEKGRGTGLGLATVYGIVKQHKGYVWTYSEPGHGTTIKVYLPQSDKPVRGQVIEAASRSPKENKETVLVVEDQSQVLMLATHILESSGYTVLTADNADAAVEIAENTETAIELLLTDVVMPDINGKALYEKLNAQLPELKVLYMSGYTDDVIVHHGIIDEGINFISKPFGVSDLETKVREALDR